MAKFKKVNMLKKNKGWMYGDVKYERKQFALGECDSIVWNKIAELEERIEKIEKKKKPKYFEVIVSDKPIKVK